MSEYSEQLLAAALAYAAQGVYVFPVDLRVRGEGKKDVRPIKEWKEASTVDPVVITGWYREQSRMYNTLAIDCGKSGIVAVDCDVSDGKQGPANWVEIGTFATVRVLTPSGGTHDYYRADSEHPVSVDNTGAVADGIDVRGQGGFVFAPPSRDPRGGSWEWQGGDRQDFSLLPQVPRVVTERVEIAQAIRRPKVANKPESPLTTTASSGGSQLFAAPSEVYDFGPGGGQKARTAAVALLAAERDAFVALTEVGSGRSHILAQRFGVLAGHGVGVFWSWEDALDTILKACADNGFTAEHGEGYAQEQAVRGLEYGMREPWVEKAVSAVSEDAVDALIAEMLTLSEVAERPAPKYLIKGLLNLESESWIIGAAGSKKSFVALDMCMHVARGLPWQGLKVNQADVIIVAAEGAGGMGRRVKAWREKYGTLPPNVHVLPRPVQTGDTEAWAVLVKACTRVLGGRDAIVVLDTQARLTVGLDENTSRDMGIFINAVTALKRATGACVLSVHHTGRSGEDARGSSALDGAQDTELTVKRDDSYAGKLLSTKQKDLDERAPLPLRFASVTVGVDEDGDDVTSLVLLEPDAWTDDPGEGRPEEHATAVRVQEPQDWTLTLFEQHRQVVKRQILQTLHDLAGLSGRTEAQVKKAVAERWYGGKVGRVAGALSAQTWDSHWTGVLAASWKEGRVVVPGEAGGWVISADYREQVSSD